jgi:hypothetical protein
VRDKDSVVSRECIVNKENFKKIAAHYLRESLPHDILGWSREVIRGAVEKTKDFLTSEINKKYPLDRIYGGSVYDRINISELFNVIQHKYPETKIQSYKSINYEELYKRVNEDSELTTILKQYHSTTLLTPEEHHAFINKHDEMNSFVEELQDFLDNNMESILEECFDACGVLDNVQVVTVK